MVRILDKIIIKLVKIDFYVAFYNYTIKTKEQGFEENQKLLIFGNVEWANGSSLG